MMNDPADPPPGLMPTLAQVHAGMATLARGFSDKNEGAGILVYWVVDQAAAPWHGFTDLNQLAP